MLPELNVARRETAPVSELMLALQCGGSDGYSGITANPALGFAADLLVQAGRHCGLSETPEIYGARTSADPPGEGIAVGEKLVDLIHWWEDYTARIGGDMNNNPVARQQAWRTDHDPGEVARRGRQGRHLAACRGLPLWRAGRATKGFVFMDSPGYDPVSPSPARWLGREHHRVYHRARLGLRL